MYPLRNKIQPYAWGSRTAIAELQGRTAPTSMPEAELWLGAHPDTPSDVVGPDGVEHPLPRLVEHDPIRQLGERYAAKWGNRLPFLLKILAADAPMSIQVHPTREQARRGFAREVELGIPRRATQRNYPDPVAKPELVCALTEFHLLAGFRDVDTTLELLRGLAVRDLKCHYDLLAIQPDRHGMRALFTSLAILSPSELHNLVPQVLDACQPRAGESGPFGPTIRTVLELGERYPDDPGVLTALLLNRLVLDRGEAMYLAPGMLHAYLSGTAVEILANSDNILRGGLTPKHVDVPELLTIVDFGPNEPPVLRGDPVAPHTTVYRTDAEEFELSRLDWLAGVRTPVPAWHAGPQVLICTAGVAVLTTPDGDRLRLGRGESTWIPAQDCAEGAVLVAPDTDAPTQLFRATAGPA